MTEVTLRPVEAQTPDNRAGEPSKPPEKSMARRFADMLKKLRTRKTPNATLTALANGQIHEATTEINSEAQKQNLEEFYKRDGNYRSLMPRDAVSVGQQIFCFDVYSGKKRANRVYRVAAINPKLDQGAGHDTVILELVNPDNPDNAGWDQEREVSIRALVESSKSRKPGPYKAVQEKGQFALPEPSIRNMPEPSRLTPDVIHIDQPISSNTPVA